MTSPLLYDPYIITNLEGQRFLDVGCGGGKWGFLIKLHLRANHPFVAGVDLFEPSLESLKKQGIYDELKLASATELPYENGSFDTAVACEVIEHLDQRGGTKLVSELKRVSKKSFIVTTPNFPCLRNGGKTESGIADFEAHLHNFLYPEFRTLGFTQIVGIGLKTPSFKLSRAFGSLGFYLPRFSQFLVGYWFADDKKRVIEIL